MMVVGYTDQAIARAHHISRRTLERMVAGLMRKTQVSNRIALGAIAAHHRWIDVEALLQLPEPETRR